MASIPCMLGQSDNFRNRQTWLDLTWTSSIRLSYYDHLSLRYALYIRGAIHKLFTVRYMRCFLNIYSTVSDAFMKLLWHNLQPNATTWTIIAQISWHPHEIIPWGLTRFGKMSVTPPPIAMLLQTTHRCIHGKALSKKSPLTQTTTLKWGEGDEAMHSQASYVRSCQQFWQLRL